MRKILALFPSISLLILTSFLLSFGLSGCGDKDKPKPKSDKATGEKITAPGSLLVVDENLNPMIGAEVLIGSEPQRPFTNNHLKTDAQGRLALPAEWTTPQHLTVQAPGMVRLTYLEQEPMDLTIQLKRKKVSSPRYEVTGDTSGYELKNYDNRVDLGMVLEGMSKKDILTLDLAKFISPHLDEMSLMGFDFSIPGNVALPKQKETYYLPVTIAKPTYRIHFDTPGNKSLFGLYGRFSFSKLVEGIKKKKKFYDFVNELELVGGVLQNVKIDKEKTSLNLNIKTLKFTGTTPIAAPPIKNTEAFIAIAATQNQNLWFPTDVRKIESQQKAQMKTLPNSPVYLVGLIKNKTDFDVSSGNADRVSASLLSPGMTNAHFTFLPLIDNPKPLSALEFLLSKPVHQLQNMNEIATYAVLSSVTTSVNPANKQRQSHLSQEWEIYSNHWIPTLKLPLVPDLSGVGPAPQTKRRLEFTYFGSTTTRGGPTGPALIENATHVTRSSIDF